LLIFRTFGKLMQCEVDDPRGSFLSNQDHR
jgi:hypothetical protein